MSAPPFDTGGHVRRCRRVGGLSQRALAEQVGLAPSVVARAETGRQDLRVQELAAVARSVGLRLTLVDEAGAVVPPMRADAVRDTVGRRFPAHVDVRHGDENWWHTEHRSARAQPTHTFSLDRPIRDDDHQAPDPRDDLAWRRAERARSARLRRREEYERKLASGELVLPTYDFMALCECPPECEELLVSDDEESQLHPHLDGCPCLCDLH